MKKTLLIICLIFSLKVQSQDYVWARKYISAPNGSYGFSFSYITAISTTAQDDLIVAGTYGDTTKIGPSTFIAPTYSDAGFVAKIHPDGNTEWIDHTSLWNDTHVYDICLDRTSTKVFVACAYTDINPGPNGAEIKSITPNGSSQTILAVPRYNNKGFCFVAIEKIALQDSILIFAGKFRDSVIIGGQLLTSPANNYQLGNFIAWYNLNTHSLTRVRHITSPVLDAISTLITDSTGNVYLSGTLSYPYGSSYTAIFDGTSVILPVRTSVAFLAKINASGNYDWVRTENTTSSVSSLGLGRDAQGRLYHATSDAIGNRSHRILKYDTAGNVLLVRYMPPSNMVGLTVSRNSIFVACNNELYSTDSLYSFTDTTIQGLYSNTILKLDTGLLFEKAITYDRNNTGGAMIQQITSTSSGLIYSDGYFRGSRIIGNCNIINPYLNSASAYYVSMISDQTDTVLGGVLISGRVYTDINANCTFDSTDTALAGINIIANPGHYITTSDSAGHYNLHLPQGTYNISEIIPEINNGQYSVVCPAGNSYITPFLSASTVDSNNNFATQMNQCTLATLAASDYLNFRCDSPFIIPFQICNFNSLTVDNAKLEIQVSDSISNVSTYPSYSYFDSARGKYVFDHLSLPADYCFTISIRGLRSCTPQTILYQSYYPLTARLITTDACPLPASLTTFDSLRINIGPPIFVHISDVDSGTTCTLYPNPVLDILHLSFPNEHKISAQLILTNLLGQQSYSSPVTETESTHDISKIPSGIYTWRLMSDNAILKTGKIVKQ